MVPHSRTVTMSMLSLVSGCALVAVLAGIGNAQPSPGNSTLPANVTVGKDCFTVTVRDFTNTPIAGETVTIEFGGCPIVYCPTQPGGLTANEGANTVSQVTNVFGEAQFCPCASIASPDACDATISAGAVVLGVRPVVRTRPPSIVGTLTGTVNGTPVNFDLDIALDYATGEETASVGNMPPALGAVMRPVTAMVTIGGPTGGMTNGTSVNLFDLTAGNFVNSATVFWPASTDTIKLVHTVSYGGGNQMSVSATIAGTAPTIALADPVVFHDFQETMSPGVAPARGGGFDILAASQIINTGPGLRPYDVDGSPWPGGGNGKYSITTYSGAPLPGQTIRAVTGLTSTYDSGLQTMNVHLFNSLTPVAVPMLGGYGMLALAGVLAAAPTILRRTRRRREGGNRA